MLMSCFASSDGLAPTCWSVPSVLKTGPGCSMTNGAGTTTSTSVTTAATAMLTHPAITRFEGAMRCLDGPNSG
jgi:hypothetical protein